MSDHCFISYSKSDGVDFVLKLADELTKGPPPLSVWLDERNLRAGFDWDDQIDKALKTSRSILFVVTLDSVDPLSVAKQEWTRALQYKKPIVPLRLHRDADPPFGLGNRQYIDFADDFVRGLAELRLHLQWLESPDGALYLLEQRLGDAERDLRRTSQPQEQVRIEEEIAELRNEIATQREALENPAAAIERVERNIERGMQAERAGTPTPDETLGRVINRPPGSAPMYFQDRVVESRLVGQFLTDESRRILTVVGRAGVGKTAMTCRVLKELERGRLLEDDAPVAVDGIVYLGSSTLRGASFGNLYADLAQLLTDAKRQALEQVWNERADLKDRVLALVSAFTNGLAVVLLDNLEDVIDPATHELEDVELRDALRQLLRLPQHPIKVIITTRIAPRDLELEYPSRYMRLDLDEGLASPYAENILRELDTDGKVGLRSTSMELLGEVRERTLGYPRALEAFFAILSQDRQTRLEDVLSKAERYLPENVVESLVAEAIHRLDPAAQRVMQVLALLDRPLLPATVDYVLRPYEPTIDSTPILQRLTNAYLVRVDQGRYYLHRVDSEYAASQVPAGSPTDWHDASDPVYSRSALMYQGAGYFEQVKTPPRTWRSIEDIAPQLAEFDLRVGCQDYARAVWVLHEVADALWVWGHYRHVIAMCERVIDGAPSGDRPEILLYSGRAHSACAENTQAVRILTEAVAASREQDAVQTELGSRGALAWSLFGLGRHDEARGEFEEMMGIAEDLQETDAKVDALRGLGAIEEAVGGIELAEEHYRAALNVAVQSLHVVLEPDSEGDLQLLSAGDVPAGAPYFDALVWTPYALFSPGGADEEATSMPLFAVPIEDLPAAPPDAEPEAEAELSVEVMLIVASETLAQIWLDFGALYARSDRLDEAQACCALAGQLFEDLGVTLRVSQAVDLADQIAAARADTATREQMKAARLELLENARVTGNRHEEVVLLLDIATAHLKDTETRDAEDAYLAAQAIARELDDATSELRAEEGLARVEWISGKTEAAVTRLQNVERRYGLGGMEEARAMTLKTIGDIELSRFNRDAALEHYLGSLRAYFALSLPDGQIDAQIALSHIALDQRDYDGSIEWLLGALRLAEAIGIRSTIASVQSQLARVYNLAGQNDLARASIEKARTAATTIELPATEASVLMDIGDISFEMDAFEDALAEYERAKAISESLSNSFEELRALQRISDVNQQVDAHEPAIAAAEAAVALAAEIRDPDEARRARITMGLALSNAGRHMEAVELLEEAVENEPRDPVAVGNLGWVLFEAGEYERSIEMSRRSSELDPAQEWTIRNVGHAYLAMGCPDKAEEAYREAIAGRRGGEHFRETIKEVKKLLARHPEVPRGAEMLALLEDAQAQLTQEPTPGPERGVRSS